jgi:hypothetical protein
MLKKTYSPLSKLSSCAFIIISRTESALAQSTTTENIQIVQINERSLLNRNRKFLVIFEGKNLIHGKWSNCVKVAFQLLVDSMAFPTHY